MICSFCAEKIKDQAVVCRHCGRDVVKKTEPSNADHIPTQAPLSINTSRSLKKSGLIAIGGVVIVLLGIGVFLFSRSESANIALCKSAVLGYLKQPSTAEWNAMTESQETYGEPYMNEDGEMKDGLVDEFVYGSVRSQNAFGAMITTNFKCSKEDWESSFEVETWEDGDSAP